MENTIVTTSRDEPKRLFDLSSLDTKTAAERGILVELDDPRNPLQKLRDATGALLADLLAAANRGLWGTGPTKQRGFTGNDIKWTAFDAVWRSMEQAGLLVHVKGHTRPKVGFIPAKHVAPVFRVTEELLALANKHGVTPWNVGLHFGDEKAVEPAAA